MPKRGKKYREALKAIGDGLRTPREAVALTKQAAFANFDESVELHVRTSADPRHADQQLREVTTLPHGTGRQVRVLVFAEGEAAEIARSAGADILADDGVIQQIESGWADFEVAIATPDQMGKIGRLGRYLGRKGLMPNPRTGTVVQAQDIPRTIEEARKGRVELRMDRTAVIHAAIGKVSFEEQQLLENLATVVSTVVKARPSAVKGQFIRSAALTSTMGPGVDLDVSELQSLTVE